MATNIVNIFDCNRIISRRHYQKEYTFIANNALVALFSAAVVAPLSAMTIYLGVTSGGTLGLIGGMIIAFLFIALAVIFISRAKRSIRQSSELAQEDRNRFASEVIKSRGLYTEHGFCLFLRPFLIDGAIKTEIKLFSEEVITRILNNTVENALAQAIDPYFPVVALEHTPLALGPGGAIVSDEDWKEVILDLMEVARLIVVVPLAQPATLWEIKQLHARSYLGKVIFFVPPLSNKKTFVSPAGEETSFRALYDYSVDRFAKEGIPMPKIGSKGGFYWLHGEHHDGGPLWRYRVFKRSHHLSYKAIRSIVFDVRNSPLSKKDIFKPPTEV